MHMPNLISDLQSTKNVCFDKFLEACLNDVALPSEVSTPPKELLAKVLEQATELCNAAPTDRAGDARTRITKSFQQYCVDTSNELELYRPFVQLSNAVLDLLAEGQFKNLLRDPDPSSILFHTNHPLTNTINGESTVRRPDIVIVAEASARAAFIPIPKPTPSREDVLDRAAAMTILKDDSNIRDQFPVGGILCNIDFKETSKPMASPPPSWVWNEDPAFSPPKCIHEDQLLTEMQEADKKWETLVPVSSPNNNNNPPTGPTGGSDSGTATGSKRKADTTDSEAGPNKRRPSPPKYPTTFQSASYALDSINRAAGVTKVTWESHDMSQLCSGSSVVLTLQVCKLSALSEDYYDTLPRSPTSALKKNSILSQPQQPNAALGILRHNPRRRLVRRPPCHQTPVAWAGDHAAVPPLALAARPPPPPPADVYFQPEG